MAEPLQAFYKSDFPTTVTDPATREKKTVLIKAQYLWSGDGETVLLEDGDGNLYSKNPGGVGVIPWTKPPDPRDPYPADEVPRRPLA